jgi:HEAT repeat protein
MKNFFSQKRFPNFCVAQKTGSRLLELRLTAASALLLVVITVFTQVASQAQGSYAPSKVTNVSAEPFANGTLISIAADSPLGRSQNWQDSEGYHLVIPNTVAADSLKAARGVRIHSVGTSLEVLLQIMPGSKVSLQPEGNRLNLVVDGRLEPRSLSGAASLGETAQTTSHWSPPTGPVANLPPEPFPKQTAVAVPESNASRVEVQAKDESLVASVFSGTSVFVVMALGLFGLLVSRNLRTRRELAQTAETPLSKDKDWLEDQTVEGLAAEGRGSQKGDVSSSLGKSNGSDATNGSSQQSVARLPTLGPTSLYGAYRIDQEVGKLVLGQPHRMDVLASRAIDDRRAIETSLIKCVNALDLDESAHRRASEALAEYGFVARQCAALLLSPDPFDRTSAAGCLGEIKSEAALPFLLEGLYDSESIVRNQAVISIGELKLPAAIGALLDIARTYPDVPSGLLSRSLSACSVEGLGFLGAVNPDLAQLGMVRDASIIKQITHLEPSSSVEELPESSDDEQLTQALSLLKSSDVHERSEALKTLAQFRIQSSVRALALAARQDSEPNIRSNAISSLGSIDHESVFPAILIGTADNAREVRAAAARALSRLSFDRADAYVRVIETGDQDTIRDVAMACIQAGIVSQNLDHLASSDHRQAYETFSLICLLAKANVNDPILEAIAGHSSIEVRLRAVHLLASTGQAGTFEQLRLLAARDEVHEEVKTALLEAMYRLDQPQPLEEEVVEPFAVDSAPQAKRPEAERVAADVALDLTPMPQPEDQPGFEAEVELKLEELEL